MVSKRKSTVPKSYNHVITAEPSRVATKQQHGRSVEPQQKLISEIRRGSSNSNGRIQTNSSERSTSSSSDRFYEHENSATSSSSPNNQDNAELVPVSAYLNSFIPQPPSRPIWARRKYLPSFEGLHDEILDLHRWIKPTAVEIGCRRKLFNRISTFLKEIWPKAVVQMFGSVATNSFLPSSDIDICILTQENLTETKLADLNKVAEMLRESHEFENIIVLDKAAVPIVKCTDQQTQLRVDINFNLNYVGLTVEWIQNKIHELPLMEPLLLVLKQFLAQRGLNDPFNGGLPSYALVSMLVYFLEDIRKKNRTDFSHLCSLEERTKHGRKPLGFLFIYFLYTFGRLDYSNFGINFFKAKNGRTCSRIVDKKELAKDYGIEVFSNGFWISDPVQKNNNIGKGAHNILAIRQAFSDAYSVLHDSLSQLNDARYYPKEVVVEYYYGPLISLLINSDLIGNRRENIMKSHFLLFGPEGGQMKREHDDEEDDKGNNRKQVEGEVKMNLAANNEEDEVISNSTTSNDSDLTKDSNNTVHESEKMRKQLY